MTTTLITRVILECDRCSEPLRELPPSSAYDPPRYEHEGTSCTLTCPRSSRFPDLPRTYPVTNPQPRRACAADGGQLLDTSDSWADSRTCAVCGASWRMSLGG
ncbi:hypothetical protein [Streptomyces sp. NRRL S-241]|uniref:hypothetical protein n=1 Tax=Streptomyces sp. NRRL S-241 TaxID=1463896 RepID=UPI0004C2513D|nr:hypothetical protein [Streptomyces sp. NRRL S-241]